MYVSSGQFEKDLIEINGPLEKRKEKPDPLSFDQFDNALAKELTALFQLYSTYELPNLCDLNWGDFYSIPDLYDADEEELRDEYDVEEDQLPLFMKSLEIFDDSGYPHITVCDAGICVADDAPWEISVWHDDFEDFLKFLVQLHAASEGKAVLADVEKEFSEAFESFEGTSFIERSVEAAKEKASDSNFAGALNQNEEVFDPSGLSFLFTGKLASMKRAEAHSRVSELGAQVSKSVNKNLDVLVIGDEGSPLFGEGTKGSKQTKAENLIKEGASLRIISESLFLKLQPES